MGGCDAIDANVAHYDIHILKRWWLNLLFWIVSILLNQAWVIHEWLRRERDGDAGKSSRKAFRLAVAQGMIDYAGKLARSAGVEVLLSNRRPSRGFRCLRCHRPPLQHLPVLRSVAAPPRRSLLRRTTAGLRQLAHVIPCQADDRRRGRCQVCYCVSRWKCQRCNIFLCPLTSRDCVVQYHQNPLGPFDVAAGRKRNQARNKRVKRQKSTK